MPTFPDKVILRSEGTEDADSADHARRLAVVHGIRLSAYCGNIWPDRDGGILRIVTEQIISELISFAIYARRFMELRESKSIKADGPLLRIELPGIRYETDIWTAVNRIVHGDRISVQSVNPVTKKHDSLGDRIIAHVTVTSRQRDTVAICPQGLFYGFARTGPADS